MSIELRVSPRQQATPMSCWWTAMAVVLDYYGQRYRYPWQYRHEFERPWNRSPGSLAYEWPTIEEAMRHDPSLRSLPIDPDPRNRDRVAPSEWYTIGVPNTVWGLRRLCTVSGFRGVPNCPGYGQWTAADFERVLRASGPIVFHGFWNGFPHSIVVNGVDTTAGQETVAFMDPARGNVLSQALARFNARMTGMIINVDAFGSNPIHYPTDRPVRAVIGS